MKQLVVSMLMSAMALTATAWAEDKSATSAQATAEQTKDLTRVELLDRIYGGWVGMLIMGIEGLAHEGRYNKEPRESLPDYQMLPKGARTDDDNDFEWTHLYFMDKDGVLKLPYPRVVEIWKENMNKGIFVANANARKLMDQGVIPPETGSAKLNGSASHNLSGQFCVESYGMIAPGMPRAAADIGMHYAHIAVSGEPIQATQYWTTLISLCGSRTNTLEDLIRESLKAVDPASEQAGVVQDCIKAFHDNPEDWKAARQTIYKKWVVARRWGCNDTPPCGGMVLLALLYGKEDFYKTGQYAMALGLDADCNAATAGAVVGVRLGFKKISALPNYKMPDNYKNDTRPGLPKELKVSEQAEMMMRVCERVILENGGQKIDMNGQPGYRILLQEPQVLEPLSPETLEINRKNHSAR